MTGTVSTRADLSGARSEPGPMLDSALASANHRAVARWRENFLDGLVFIVAILPLLLTAHIPLADLPNHLATQFVVGHWQESPILREYYRVHFAITPNLAFEL